MNICPKPRDVYCVCYDKAAADYLKNLLQFSNLTRNSPQRLFIKVNVYSLYVNDTVTEPNLDNLEII